MSLLLYKVAGESLLAFQSYINLDRWIENSKQFVYERKLQQGQTLQIRKCVVNN